MTQKKPRTPQEKKSLSYANDRRNSYGANDKAARKSIPARKAGENRKVRRKVGQELTVIDRLPEVQADVAESSIRHDLERLGGWKKGADIPLQEFIELQGKRRSWRGLGPTRRQSSDQA